MKNFYLVFKLLLLFIIFFFVFKCVNINETINVLKKTNLYLLFIAVVINNVSNIFLTIKWHRLTIPLNLKSSFLDLLKLNYISIFYSMILPGQASGELIKGLKLAKQENSHQNVWIPIFIDKITNLLITFIIGFVAVLFDETFKQNVTVIFTISALTVLCSTITILLFSEKTSEFINLLKNTLISILKVIKIESNKIKGFSIDYFQKYKKHDFLMYETLLWSLLIKLPHIFAFYFLAIGLNINLNLIQSAWLFSIVSIVSLLPISFSGLGVREGTVIVLLSQIGIDNSSSLSLSVLIFTVSLITGLIGGLIELFSGFKIKK